MEEVNPRAMTRDELIRFMEDIDTEWGMPGGEERWEANADLFIRRFCATDFNPERCPYAWTPELGNGVCYGEVRCTERADNAGHEHGWTQADQDKWTAQTKATVIAALAECLDVPEAVMVAEETSTSRCICAEPLREGDILAPCPVHGWVTH